MIFFKKEEMVEGVKETSNSFLKRSRRTLAPVLRAKKERLLRTYVQRNFGESGLQVAEANHADCGASKASRRPRKERGRRMCRKATHVEKSEGLKPDRSSKRSFKRGSEAVKRKKRPSVEPLEEEERKTPWQTYSRRTSRREAKPLESCESESGTRCSEKETPGG